MSTPLVRRVSHSEILCAVNAQQLIAEYAAECSVPDADPQVEKYAALEAAGALACFGAYVGEELVGFASILMTGMLHTSKRVANIESLFVSSSQRFTGAGNALLLAAELDAAASGCVQLLATARIGSRLDKILTHRAGCKVTHVVFTTWL